MEPSSEYEQFIEGLVRDLHRNADISDLRSGRNNCHTGASGVRHQVDVSFVDYEISPHALVVIECKHVRDRIELGNVKVLKATIDDLAGHAANPETIRGILVSLNEPQSGAATYANYYGIDLQRVPVGPCYSFTYKHRKLVAAAGVASGRSFAQGYGDAIRSCNVCGRKFAATGVEEICTDCIARPDVG